MAETKTLVTAEEFFAMPSSDRKAELVRGEVIWMSPTGYEHGVICAKIARLLGVHVEAHQLGEVCGAETGFLAARHPDTVRAPDAAFIAKERLPKERPKIFLPFAPDLALEVVSPSDSAEEIQQKVREYFAAGTRMVWVVYPTTRTVHIYCSPTDVKVLTEESKLNGGDVVPAFSCPVAEIFR